MMLSLRRKGRNNSSNDGSKQPAGRGIGAASTTTTTTTTTKKKKKTEPAAAVAASAAAAAENGNNKRTTSGVKRPPYRAVVAPPSATSTATINARHWKERSRLLRAVRGNRHSMGDDEGGRMMKAEGDAAAAPSSANPSPGRRRRRRRQLERRREKGEDADDSGAARSIDSDIDNFDELMNELMVEIEDEANAAAEISRALTRDLDSSVTTTTTTTTTIATDGDGVSAEELARRYPTQQSTVPDVDVDVDVDIDDDYREIARLERECDELSRRMSTFLLHRCDRKYTREHYDMELRLKIAREELEAAREDRDLHFRRRPEVGGVGSGGGDVEEAGATNPETSTTTTNRRDDDDDGGGGGGVDDGELKHEGRRNEEGGGVESAGGGADSRMVEYRRIESELSSLAKFSPEWFRLKEELFELSIALNDRVDDKDDDDVVEEEEDDTPREINVLLSSPGSTPCDGGDCVSPLSPTAPLCSPREGGEEEEEEEEIRSRPISSPSSTTSRNRRRDRSLDGGRRSLFSSSSPRPPVSPVIRGSLSPPPPARRGLHESFPLDRENTCNNSSPHRSISSGRSGGGSPLPYHSRGNLNIYCRTLGDDDDDNDSDEDDSKSEEAKERVKDTRLTAVGRLRAEHASSTQQLERLPEFSKEWFDVKTRIVGLYDQIVRLEKSEGGTAGEFGGAGLDGFSGGRDGGSLGGDGESHTTTKNDESYISGWSSVWSESEDEIWSHADDLECVMVSEALKYQRQQQHSLSCDDDVDEDDAVREDSELLLMPPQSSAAARIGCFVEKQDTEEEDEKLMRSKSPVGVEVKADYLAVEESWQDDAEADKILTSNHDSEVSSAQAVDSMLNEFASLLNGNCKQDDYVEKQNYFAIMIQEQWKKYVACRTLMLMRRRALQYREAQNKKPRKSCQQGCQWQASSAALIQNRWRLYTRCKLLISMRHRAEQYNHQRPQLHFETVAATLIQSHWRKCIRCCEYKQQVNAAVVIQSQLRKYWLTTGKLYTDRREIVFHSPSLGIKLQRGRDGFVRVRSVAEIESPPSYSSTARDGRITHGDIVLDAGGMNLCCPITTSHWVDVVGQIRSAPRPVTFVIANIPRKDVVQATLVIQPRVRLWLTQRVFGRKLDNKKMKAEMETAESSSSDTPDEPEAKVLALSTRLKKGQESAPRLNSIQEELHVMREMEYHHDEEEQKEEDGECPVDLYDSQGDSSTNHQLIVALLRDKFERSAHLSISKEDDNIIVNSPRGSPVPVALSSPNTSPSQEVSSSMDMSELRVSVTNIRQTWESNASSPISPENDVPYSTVRFELRSPEIGFRNVNLAKSRKKERILTPEEKMKKLSTELIILSERLKTLPRFSPEWTLSKMEVTLVTEELQYLVSENSSLSQPDKYRKYGCRV